MSSWAHHPHSPNRSTPKSPAAQTTTRCSGLSFIRTLPAAALFTLCGALLVTSHADCPTGYICGWEKGVYVLHCNLVPSPNPQPSPTLTDIPTNATRIKIKCFSQRVAIRLNFSSQLTNIRDLTLDTFNVTSASREIFRGLARLTSLTLRNLYWRRLERETFSGLTSLRSLSVENLDSLEYLHPDLLRSLPALDSLSFRHVGAATDLLMYADYAAVLRGVRPGRLRTLALYAVHSETHPETKLNVDRLFSRGSASRALHHLDLGSNNIVSVAGDPVRCWPVLEYVSLAGNSFLGAVFVTAFWVRFYTHPRLTTVDLSRNNERALSSGDAVFSLTVDETCEAAVPFNLGPRMESVSISHSTYIANSHTRHYPMCFRNRNESMRYVDLSNTRATVALSFSIVQLRALQYLNVQDLNMQRLRGELFRDMRSLRMLLLGRNNIGASIANDTRHALFARNTDLRLLDLAACHIADIPPDEFSDLRHLRVLNLSANEIANFTVRLDKLTSLRLLNISHNRLTTLPVTTMKDLDHVARTIQVDISANPLLCDSEFVTWAKSTKVHFLRAEQTFCEDDNGTRRVEFGVVTTVSDRLIVDNRDRTVAIAVSLSVITLVVPAVIFALYRCRWKLALCCHRMRSGTPKDATPLDRMYKRDAFICYNSSDRAWVCGDLLRHLEDNAITTILHHRDFLPGSVLEDTIRESVAMCRYVVLVLSPDFLASNWCLLEMHLARGRVTSEGRDVIVPVILRAFPAAQVTRTLETILSTSYLEWTEDSEGQTLFWDKLVTKLKHGGNIRPLDSAGGELSMRTGSTVELLPLDSEDPGLNHALPW